jgi:type IV secretory pathway VirB4 component
LQNETPLFKPFFGILLKKLSSILDGKPTIINLNPANIIYQIEAFSLGMEKWLKELESKNALALLSFYKEGDLLLSKPFKQHFNLYGTKMLFSDKFADKNFRKALSLTDEELYKVRSYDLSRRVFMLKQDQDTLILSLQLDGLKEELEILCS